MSGRYYLRTKKCDFSGIAQRLHVDPVLVRLMCNRDVPEEQMEAFLRPGLQDLHDPYLLPDAGRGARILADRIREGASVRIIGDYDADGVCSTCILLNGLKALGADADYRIPERERHGYGLNEELIDLALSDGRQVLLTCDNGISETNPVARAKAGGMTVIITDHHNVPASLPPADALIDPKITRQDGSCSYPFPEICGAVVAMKFLQVLYAEMGEDPEQPLQYLELAAFATVCDVMPLKDENRAIVSLGLSAVKNTQNRGLRALMEVNQIETVKAWHFGFVLGPCINAAGRLRTAEEAMKLLLSQTDEEARRQAAVLKELNESRKSLTEKSVQDAFAQIGACEAGILSTDRVLVIHLPECPDSIAGIVAGKVRERVCRPVFIASGNGEIVKGSARSIPAYSLYDEMTKAADVFEKFGGHPLAAGFSVRKERLGELRARLNANCTLTPAQLEEKKYIDINMPMSYVTIPLLEQFGLLEPFGAENPAPVFAEKNRVLLHARRIGKERNYLRFCIGLENRKSAEAVYFGDAGEFLSRYRARFGETPEELLLTGRGVQTVSFTYQPQINVYRGEKQISYKIMDFIF